VRFWSHIGFHENAGAIDQFASCGDQPRFEALAVDIDGQYDVAPILMVGVWRLIEVRLRA